MNLTDLFLGELEREAAATRRTLERVPEGRYDWKPHEKSMTLGRLAELVARLPSWPVFMIKQDELELTTQQSQPLRTSRELRRCGHRQNRKIERAAAPQLPVGAPPSVALRHLDAGQDFVAPPQQIVDSVVLIQRADRDRP